VLGLAALGLAAPPLQAETLNCTPVTSLPWTITTQGIHCLKGDLATSIATGAAITIATNNVILDLNGYKLGGLSAGPATQAYGILAEQRQNITVQNGTIRGFRVAVYLFDSPPFTTSQGHRIEGIRADQNTFDGFVVIGRGNVVRDNVVVATGGASGPFAGAGILVRGPGNRILDNDVITVGPPDPGHGIAVVQGDAMVVGNRVTGCAVGIAFLGASTGKYRGNLTAGVATPFAGGTDAGGNN
jgi:hypothetical protein